MWWCVGLVAWFLIALMVAPRVGRMLRARRQDYPQGHEHQSDDNYSVQEWYKTTQDE